mgnify:CR=1 FL=1
MSKNEKCHYTNMLNRLKILDEQICQMQTTLKSFKDMMRKNFEENLIESSDGEKDADQIREMSLDAMMNDKTGDASE